MDRKRIVFLAILAGALAGCQPALEVPTFTPVPVEAQPTFAVEATATSGAATAGLRVVFLRNEEGEFRRDDVWLWEEGGSVLRLSKSGWVTKVAISDDGQRVAYVRSDDYSWSELWVVDSDGMNERRLVSNDEMNTYSTVPDGVAVVPHQIEWVSGTHMLVYNTHTLFMGPGIHLNDDLYLVNVDTLSKQVLLAPGTGGEFVFSPDGSQIALVTPSSISLVDADGANRRDNVLTYGRIGLGEDLYYPQPVWSVDSQTLGVPIPSTGPFDDKLGPTALWVIPESGAPPTQLGSVEGVCLDAVTFSPDLNRIAYQRPVKGTSGKMWELHLANADGSEDIVYDTAAWVEFRGWAPDGDRFVYMVEDRAAKLGQIGGDPVLLDGVTLDNALPFPVTWVSSDRFLYHGRTAGFELHLAGPDFPDVKVGEMGDVHVPYFDFID